VGGGGDVAVMYSRAGCCVAAFGSVESCSGKVEWRRVECGRVL